MRKNNAYLIPLNIVAILLLFLMMVFFEGANNNCAPVAVADVNELEITNDLIQYIEDFNEGKGHIIEFVNPVIGYHCYNSYANNIVLYNDSFATSITVNGDDNIVNFVPKSYFAHATNKLYIGPYYGYAIRTEECNGYNLSTVILLLNENEWMEEMEEFRSGVKIEKKGFITAKHKWATPKELSAYCMLTEDENEKRFFRFFGDEALETNDDNRLPEIDKTEQMRYIHYVTIAQTDDIRWDINVEIILTRI